MGKEEKGGKEKARTEESWRGRGAMNGQSMKKK